MKSDIARCVLLCAILFAVDSFPPARAQIMSFEPFDEASEDSSFLGFRARLMEAIQQRDSAYVHSILATNVLNSLGGAGGRDEFWEIWSGTEIGDLWGTLGTVLAHGGAFHGDTMFVAPYVKAGWPRQFDIVKHGVVLGHDVRVRSEPSVNSSVVAKLSYQIVSAQVLSRYEDTGGAPIRWVPIQLADGREGFVADHYIWSPIRHRASFVKRGGRWLMRSLVGGE